MGRYHWSRKNTVEESLKLSIFRLKKWNLLNGYASTKVTWTQTLSGRKSTVLLWVHIKDDPHIRLQYTLISPEGNKREFDYEVPLTTTTCHFGGVRYWFCCRVCGNNVGCLYKTGGEDYFLCRHCNCLTYQSRNEYRLGRFGQLGYAIKAEKRLQELQEEVGRQTWRGKPTRKIRRINTIKKRLETTRQKIEHFSL